MKTYHASIQLDVRGFTGKTFKVLCDTIRSGIKNEHGFNATKGLTDNRLGSWPTVIRFKTEENRKRFMDTLHELFKPKVINRLALRILRPTASVKNPWKSVCN